VKIDVRSVFDWPPERVWDEVQTSALLTKVVRPLLQIKPAGRSSLPERWQEGQSVSCRIYLFGFLPLGKHTIRFDRIDPQSRQIQTKESGRLIRRFRHRIGVAPTDGNRALYSDEIEIDCGLLTHLAGALVRVFFRHRHRRWKKLIGQTRRAVTEWAGTAEATVVEAGG
jgi:hypothetical protein